MCKLYSLFSLLFFQILYERLLSAKLNAASSESKWRTGEDTGSDPYARWIASIIFGVRSEVRSACLFLTTVDLCVQIHECTV